jgi:DNA-binding MarR family transcriptional regulator
VVDVIGGINNLAAILDLALARAVVVRDVDADLGTYHGLSLSDFAILRELGAAPGHRLRRAELAERLGVTPSGVARQLAPLERMGLVDREPHARDARLALVVLTETGERVLGEAHPTAEEAAGRALSSVWPADDRERLAGLLARIRD